MPTERKDINSLTIAENNLSGQEMFKILDKAKKLESMGKKIIHLELGQARFQPPVNLKKALIKSIMEKNYGYCSSFGLIELREGIVKKVSNINVNIDNVIISTANLLITQALHLLCNINDKVIVFTPTFPTYISSCQFLNLQLKEINLEFKNNFNLTIEDIDLAVKSNPRAIIINSGNNPTGAVYSSSNLDYLDKVCKLNNIWLISDETYRDLSYGVSYHSMDRYDNKNIIIISSFSKIFSIPGFRLGFAISNKMIIDKLALSNATLFSCLPIFTQFAISEIICTSDKYISNVNHKTSFLIKKVILLLSKSKWLKSSYVAPKSGFYIFLDISKSNLSGVEFCEMILNKYSVACTPGVSFGQSFDSYVRLSICGKNKDVIQGVSRIINYFGTISYDE
jgi:aspartate/methionine/tyrosine aminotransferase